MRPAHVEPDDGQPDDVQDTYASRCLGDDNAVDKSSVGSFRRDCVVLSIAKLTPGQEQYYESSVAEGLDGYYAGRGESALAAESGGSDWM
jgi:hypothetical protein